MALGSVATNSRDSWKLVVKDDVFMPGLNSKINMRDPKPWRLAPLHIEESAAQIRCLQERKATSLHDRSD
jgi:hypothetical protein